MISLDKNRDNKLPYVEARGQGFIDELCIPLCDIFNELGITTLFCCQGHEEGDAMSIIFEPSIGDDEIINFLKFTHDVWPEVAHNGSFLKWYRYHKGILLINWMYQITGFLDEVHKGINADTRYFRKVVEYVKDSIVTDVDKLIICPGL
jgi:hypothetical protein